MGLILSRFRKKKSTLEVLESLEKDIRSIEEYGQSTERQHKAVVGRLVLFSVGIYVLAACLFYFFFFPASLYDQLLYVIPLLIFPLIIIFVKRVVSWWYGRRLSRNHEKLADIKRQKKELLEEVMDKETYKVARQILEKFAPEHLRKTNSSNSNAALNKRANVEPVKPANQPADSKSLVPVQPGSMGSELRRRHTASPSASSVDLNRSRQVGLVAANSRVTPGGVATPGTVLTSESTSEVTATPVAVRVSTGISTTPGGTSADAASASAVVASDKPGVNVVDEKENDNGDDNDSDEADIDSSSAGAEVADNRGEKRFEEEGPRKGGNFPAPGTSPTMNLARPIIPRDRTVMDRLVEYLVGDGLNQRYALVCRHCHSHNGMALKEEFEYLAFRCCYCFQWNPARKQRLQAPRFKALPSTVNATTTASSSTESNTEEENESAQMHKKIVSQEDEKEIKSESQVHKTPTSSGDEGNDAHADADVDEPPSSTESEHESPVPGHTRVTPSGVEDVVTVNEPIVLH